MTNPRRAVLALAGAAALLALLAGCAGHPGRGSGAEAGVGPKQIPVGYRLSPAGHQLDLGDLPLSSALSPDRRWLAVSNDGQGMQSLQLIDAASGSVRQTLRYPAPSGLFVGLGFAPGGRMLYASGGGTNLIHRYSVGDRALRELPPIPLPTTDPAGRPVNVFPAGIAVTPDGQRLLVADEQADALTVLDLRTGHAETVVSAPHPWSRSRPPQLISDPPGPGAGPPTAAPRTCLVTAVTSQRRLPLAAGGGTACRAWRDPSTGGVALSLPRLGTQAEVSFPRPGFPSGVATAAFEDLRQGDPRRWAAPFVQPPYHRYCVPGEAGAERLAPDCPQHLLHPRILP